jgi:hypothetical protein
MWSSRAKIKWRPLLTLDRTYGTGLLLRDYPRREIDGFLFTKILGYVNREGWSCRVPRVGLFLLNVVLSVNIDLPGFLSWIYQKDWMIRKNVLNWVLCLVQNKRPDLSPRPPWGIFAMLLIVSTSAVTHSNWPCWKFSFAYHGPWRFKLECLGCFDNRPYLCTSNSFWYGKCRGCDLQKWLYYRWSNSLLLEINASLAILDQDFIHVLPDKRLG